MEHDADGPPVLRPAIPAPCERRVAADREPFGRDEVDDWPVRSCVLARQVADQATFDYHRDRLRVLLVLWLRLQPGQVLPTLDASVGAPTPDRLERVLTP